MKRYRGPVLTLLAVVGLGFALVAVNGGTPPPTPAADVAAEPAPAPPTPVAAPVEAAPVEVAYAGRTSGNEATIAVAVKDGKAIAYVCDGKKVEAWLEGSVADNTLELSAKDGATASGNVTPEAVDGTVTAAGKTWTFTAQRAGAPAGTYRADVSIAGVQTRIGWNVLPDGSVVGLLSDPSGTAPAPPLDASARAATLDGTALDVRPVTGTDEVG